ncbi:protein Wnt-16 isoform X3 [Poecilia reticulata]|uniref:protein Wnt-16 isoform X3 n=1 Tax=Poecilia reticulata TaxID=8081 RepID=UPI0004A4140C|nr:PREDICTED: protein Wnt-16 isoform X3 [Poecilia reticulata]
MRSGLPWLPKPPGFFLRTIRNQQFPSRPEPGGSGEPGCFSALFAPQLQDQPLTSRRCAGPISSVLDRVWVQSAAPGPAEGSSGCGTGMIRRTGRFWWLGVTSCGDPVLSGRQRALCRGKPFLLPGVRDGARLAVAECRNQFRLERWNCSTTRNPAAVFGHELTSGTKETAFIYAVMAAGLVHSITRSCSQGNMTECGCDARLRGGGTGAAEGWHWGGCSDHIRFGTWFSRRFMDVSGTNSSTGRVGFTLSTMNQHNAEAGRQLYFLAAECLNSDQCRHFGLKLRPGAVLSLTPDP